MSEVTDLVLPVLRKLQVDIAEMKTGLNTLGEKVDGLTARMDAFEGYFTYSMGLNARNAADIETIRDDLKGLRARVTLVESQP